MYFPLLWKLIITLKKWWRKVLYVAFQMFINFDTKVNAVNTAWLPFYNLGCLLSPQHWGLNLHQFFVTRTWAAPLKKISPYSPYLAENLNHEPLLLAKCSNQCALSHDISHFISLKTFSSCSLWVWTQLYSYSIHCLRN